MVATRPTTGGFVMPHIVIHPATDFDMAYLGVPGVEISDPLAFWIFCIDTMLEEISEALHPPCDLLGFPPPRGSESVCLERARALLERCSHRHCLTRGRRERNRRRVLALTMLVEYLRRIVAGKPCIAPQICAERQAARPEPDLLKIGACVRRCETPLGAAEA